MRRLAGFGTVLAAFVLGGMVAERTNRRWDELAQVCHNPEHVRWDVIDAARKEARRG